ncbi:hypothetical protein K474DRAFT_242699 [Panus rudis PR-1116 ss-1]|nr:hypothetical protein K474DRAFT_242699 [Panus rudis PR-1116 ss-1]
MSIPSLLCRRNPYSLPEIACFMSARASPTSSSEASTSKLSSPRNTPQPETNNGGKVKRTRRRQRLSCVECTKRRQKCDRQFPCGLCTSRGIPHLCRWEPIVVRPEPQRPPVIPGQTTSEATATIQALVARVAALEEALSKKTAEAPKETTTRKTGSSALSPIQPTFIPNNDEHIAKDDGDLPAYGEGPRRLLDYNVQVAAVALAQLSLAPRTEYVGSGTVISALNKLGDPSQWRVPYSRSVMTTTSQYASVPVAGPSQPSGSPIRRLLAQLPSRSHLDELLDSYFSFRNGEFGVSEFWVRTACRQMWYHLDIRCSPECLSTGSGCQACREDINPHWLSLLFAILAHAPASGPNGRHYADASLAARRWVEDVLFASPAYASSEGCVQGGVLSCLGAGLLAAWLADRGRVSESWKLVGNAIRNAQALGLHRDPRWTKWETMGPIETDLRKMAWWTLTVADRLYSFVLGRPPMTIKGTFEPMPGPPEVWGDGTPNQQMLYQQQLVLLTDVMCEASIKCLGLSDPSYSTVIEMDAKFQEWQSQLPARLDWRLPYASPSPSSSPSQEHIEDQSGPSHFIIMQRTILACWYLDTLMGIHRPYLMRSPPTTSQSSINPSRERCIELAIELTTTLCQFFSDITSRRPDDHIFPNMFSYFLFDGAVALAGALSQNPPHARAKECLDCMDKAMHALQYISKMSGEYLDGSGETANRALKVLTALHRAGGWASSGDHPEELGAQLGTQVPGRSPHESPAAASHSPYHQSRSGSPSSNFFHSNATSAPSSHHTFHDPAQSGESPAPWLSSNIRLREPFYSSTNVTPESHRAPTGESYLSPYYPATLDASISSQVAAVGRTQLLNPYEVLQGVQQPIPDVQLDWSRLPSVQGWYGGDMMD